MSFPVTDNRIINKRVRIIDRFNATLNPSAEVWDEREALTVMMKAWAWDLFFCCRCLFCFFNPKSINNKISHSLNLQ